MKVAVAADAARYIEPARRYTSSLALAALIAAGFVVDMVLGGGRAHLIGWVIAFVLLVGIDALVVHAARSVRSIAVSGGRLAVGEDALDCAEIADAELGVDGEVSATLGRLPGEGLPRGVRGLTLRLRDGRRVAVPTRYPERLAAVLEAGLHVPEIRPADPDELPLLADIDQRAEALFRVAGMELPVVPFPVDQLRAARAIFVIGRPAVGFVQLDEVDGLAHVQELAVLPSEMRRGHGTALLEAACEWARARGYPSVTLTTYADVPWNGPFYAARGFTELTDLGPELVELRDWEQAIGLDAAGRRIVMVRRL